MLYADFFVVKDPTILAATRAAMASAAVKPIACRTSQHSNVRIATVYCTTLGKHDKLTIQVVPRSTLASTICGIVNIDFASVASGGTVVAYTEACPIS